MIIAIFGILDLLLSVLGWIIIAQVVLGWLIVFNVLNTRSQGIRTFLDALNRFLEPLYRPVRKILPDFGGIDFAPLVVLLLIQVLRMLLGGVAAELAFNAA
jgi:YggT family protein